MLAWCICTKAKLTFIGKFTYSYHRSQQNFSLLLKGVMAYQFPIAKLFLDMDKDASGCPMMLFKSANFFTMTCHSNSFFLPSYLRIIPF